MSAPASLQEQWQEERKWGCWERGWVSLMSPSQEFWGFPRPFRVFAPANAGRSTHGQGLLLRDHQVLHILRDAVTTRHGRKGQSAKSRLPPGALRPWQDRPTLKGPCSWQLTAASTLGLQAREDLDTDCDPKGTIIAHTWSVIPAVWVAGRASPRRAKLTCLEEKGVQEGPSPVNVGPESKGPRS